MSSGRISMETSNARSVSDELLGAGHEATGQIATHVARIHMPPMPPAQAAHVYHMRAQSISGLTGDGMELVRHAEWLRTRAILFERDEAMAARGLPSLFPLLSFVFGLRPRAPRTAPPPAHQPPKPARGNPALAGIGRQEKYLGRRIGTPEYFGECMEAVRILIAEATGVATGGGGNPAGFVQKCVDGGATLVSDTTYAQTVPPPGLLPGDVITVYPGKGETWAGPIHTFIVGDPATTAIQQNFPKGHGIRDDLTVEHTLKNLGAGQRNDVHIVVLRFPPKA